MGLDVGRGRGGRRKMGLLILAAKREEGGKWSQMLAREGEEGGKWGKMLRSDEGENWAIQKEGEGGELRGGREIEAS